MSNLESEPKDSEKSKNVTDSGRLEKAQNLERDSFIGRHVQESYQPTKDTAGTPPTKNTVGTPPPPPPPSSNESE